MGSNSSFAFITVFLSLSLSTAFQSPIVRQRAVQKEPKIHQRPVAVTPPEGPFLFEKEEDYRITKEESQPLIRVGEGSNEKIVNAFGLWCAAVSLFTGPIWSAAMFLIDATLNKMDNVDPHRSIYDATGKVWAKTWLTLTNSYPTISGNLQYIQNNNAQPCLYVANHASWLDIPVLCTVLDPVFKFIAKGELRKVPCIGQQLQGGQHILIDRSDRRSQLKTFKDALYYVQKARVPIMAFPEGQRSADGRLSEFKRGLFAIALKAGVPVVPITVSHTAAVMPSFAYFPVQPGRGKVHVHVGTPIRVVEGMTEGDLEAAVRAEFMEHLPASQLPVSSAAASEGSTSAPVAAKESSVSKRELQPL